WKYQQRKKEQKARSNSKTSELREVRLRPKIDTHDLNIKLGKAREFLGDNDKVQFTLLFRGREMAHRDLGYKLMMDVKEQLAEISKVETEPRQQGRRMTMVLSPSKKQGAAKPKPTESTEEPEGSTAGEPANPGLGAGQGLNIPASVVPSTENSD
ncbi:MAG: translation initiation factor IF-3, partial [Phycisphaeraceae bacterium]|nr:translation initiation factor IF-3 [Phycisphaeraceae bacterium]